MKYIYFETVNRGLVRVIPRELFEAGTIDPLTGDRLRGPIIRAEIRENRAGYKVGETIRTESRHLVNKARPRAGVIRVAGACMADIRAAAK